MHGIIKQVSYELSYPLELIRSAIMTLEDCTSWQQKNCLQPFLLYCLQPIDKDHYLPLNRWYKPIGLLSGRWVCYENFPFLYIKKERCDPPHPGVIIQGETIFFYNDSSSPKHDKNGYIEKVKHTLLV